MFTFGEWWFSFDVHIVTADFPLLLGMTDMDRPGIYFNNLEDLLVHPSSGKKVSTTLLFGLFLYNGTHA